MNASPAQTHWDERASAFAALLDHTGGVFKCLRARTADATWLYGPPTAWLIDCNQAAVEITRAVRKQQWLRSHREETSAPSQPDGSSVVARAGQFIPLVKREKRHRFERMIWTVDGRDVPVDGITPALTARGKRIPVAIARDIIKGRGRWHHRRRRASFL